MNTAKINIALAREADERADRAWLSELHRAAERRERGFTNCAPDKVAAVLPDFDAVGWELVNQRGLLDADFAAEQADISAEDRAFAFSADGEFLAMCRDRTGEVGEQKVLRRQARDSARLLAQSVELADKMGAAGFNCYRDSGFARWRYGIHSRHRERLPDFRRVCFLPVVAQSVRAPMLAAVEHFIACNPFVRLWTFTSGKRVPLRNVRARAQWMHRRLSEMNDAPFMKAAGAELVLRSTEMGTPECDERGNATGRNAGRIQREKGTLFFNVHAHCVLNLKRGPMKPEKWSRFLVCVHRFWKRHWQDGDGQSGVIRNARELVKYVTKPGEMLKLSGPELVSLQEQLSRLKLVQAMGSLAKEMRKREETGGRLVRHRTADGMVYRVVKNWNRHGRKTATEKAHEAALKLARPETRNAALRVISRGTPTFFGPRGISEPTVCVMGPASAWCESSVRALRPVADLITATADAWEEGVAVETVIAAGPMIRVHTCTPTVPARPRGKPHRSRIGAAAQGF